MSSQNFEIELLGKQIKDIRLSKGLKILEVSSKAGISKGLLSKIENARTIPSVPVLFSLIDALGENPSSFFENMRDCYKRPYFLLIPGKNYKPEVKEDSIGFHYFSIISQSFDHVVFKVSYLELESEAKREQVTTDGFEFIFLISGTIDYKLDRELVTLHEGDSLFFDGRIPHVKLNPYPAVAKILVIYLLSNPN